MLVTSKTKKSLEYMLINAKTQLSNGKSLKNTLEECWFSYVNFNPDDAKLIVSTVRERAEIINSEIQAFYKAEQENSQTNKWFLDKVDECVAKLDEKAKAAVIDEAMAMAAFDKAYGHTIQMSCANASYHNVYDEALPGEARTHFGQLSAMMFLCMALKSEIALPTKNSDFIANVDNILICDMIAEMFAGFETGAPFKNAEQSVLLKYHYSKIVLNTLGYGCMFSNPSIKALKKSCDCNLSSLKDIFVWNDFCLNTMINAVECDEKNVIKETVKKSEDIKSRTQNPLNQIDYHDKIASTKEREVLEMNKKEIRKVDRLFRKADKSDDLLKEMVKAAPKDIPYEQQVENAQQIIETVSTYTELSDCYSFSHEFSYYVKNLFPTDDSQERYNKLNKYSKTLEFLKVVKTAEEWKRTGILPEYEEVSFSDDESAQKAIEEVEEKLAGQLSTIGIDETESAFYLANSYIESAPKYLVRTQKERCLLAQAEYYSAVTKSPEMTPSEVALSVCSTDDVAHVIDNYSAGRINANEVGESIRNIGKTIYGIGSFLHLGGLTACSIDLIIEMMLGMEILGPVFGGIFLIGTAMMVVGKLTELIGNATEDILRTVNVSKTNEMRKAEISDRLCTKMAEINKQPKEEAKQKLSTPIKRFVKA